MPFFSLVTAIKDGLGFFKETAPTVLAQTFRDWEWIIVDDGSTEIIEGYVRSLNDERVRVFRNTQSLGQTRSLNFGIRQCRANWIVRMDGDDLAAPDRLERTAQFIHAAGAKPAPLIFSDYFVIDENGEPVAGIRYRALGESGFYEYLRKNNPICHPSVVFKKNSPAGEPYFFDESLQNAQDYALWRRIYNEHGPVFGHIPKPLISYRLVRSSLSGARAPEQQEELKRIRGEVAVNAVPPMVLADRAREGMHAFRTLYYRFVGSDSESLHINKNDLLLLASVIRYPRAFVRAVVFLALRPCRRVLKRVLFSGVYE